MLCDLLEGLLVFPTTEFMYPELLLKHRKCWTTAVISMDRKTYRSDDIEKLSFFISLMCQNTVLQIKPVWLLPLKFSDSQTIQTFSKRYWHRYKQKKVKFAVSTHLTCRICNLAVLCTFPVAWWSSTECSLSFNYLNIDAGALYSCTTRTLTLAKEGQRMHMTGTVQSPFSRKCFTCHFAQRDVFQGQKQKALQKFLHELEIKVIPARDGLTVCIFGGGISEEGKYPSTPSWVFNTTL